jgi:FSR family fosmidomycin resistance protein-like MFS transporter
MQSESRSIKTSHAMAVIYSIAHFAVDFGCAFLMLGSLTDPAVSENSSSAAVLLLLYNFFAFAMQMPIGLIADSLNRNCLVASAGGLLTALAYGLTSSPYAAAIAAGLGNALFHFGGGIDVLNISTESSRWLGIFVSPGAFGVYFGNVLGKLHAFSSIIVVAALLVLAVIIPLSHYISAGSFASGNERPAFIGPRCGGSRKGLVIALICLFLVVCIRSYLGMVMRFPWKSGIWAALLICGVVFGKAAGGFLCDRIGATAASCLSLGLAAVLFLLSGSAVFGILAVFFFNMTMPITLWAVARLFPGAKGFSFGLLTFALFLGFLPVQMNVPAVVTGGAGYSIACLISLLLMALGLRGEAAK